MSYEPTIWKKGDKVTSTKLNKIENGIQGNDEEITSIKEDLTDKAPVITETASGSIASFNDGADNLPLKSLVVNINPVQDLHGQDAPYPAGGGKNKFNGTFLQGYWAYADGTWVNSRNWITTEKIPCKASTSYTVSADAKVTRWQGFVWYDSNGDYISTDNLNSNVNIGLTKTSPSNAAYLIFNIAGYPGANDTIAPSDVTYFQLEEGSSSTAYAPYSNICPISGWTGANVYHSGADTSDATTYSITFPSEAGTVYSGTLDVTTGKLTVDRAMVDLGAKNWYPSTAARRTRFRTSITDIERISSPNVRASLLCSNYPTKTANQTYQGTTGVSLQQNEADIYIYDPQTESMTGGEFKSAMSGVQLVYKLATPQTYQLTPTEVTTLLGDNTIWADTGDTEVEYRTDPDLYIQRKMSEVPVDDVQINGISIVSDGVANVPVDTSLTIAGAAADAKKTGDEIGDLKEDFTKISDKSAIDFIGGNLNIDGNPLRIIQNNVYASITFACQPGRTYTVTREYGNRFSVVCTSIEPASQVPCEKIVVDPTLNSYTFIPPAGAKYVVVTLQNDYVGTPHTHEEIIASCAVYAYSATDYDARKNSEQALLTCEQFFIDANRSDYWAIMGLGSNGENYTPRNYNISSNVYLSNIISVTTDDGYATRYVLYNSNKGFIYRSGFNREVINIMSLMEEYSATYVRFEVQALDESGIAITTPIDDVSRYAHVHFNVLREGGIKIAGASEKWYEDSIVKSTYLDRIKQAKYVYANTDSGVSSHPVLTLLHFSDVHGNADAMWYALAINNIFSSDIDDMLHTGDVVTANLSDGISNWVSSGCANKVLNVIGNHDTEENLVLQAAGKDNVYNTIFAPYISQWGVIQPTGVDTSGSDNYHALYYYKDYSAAEVRLIVLDTNFWDAAQKSWLTSVLTDAKTNGMCVVIACHNVKLLTEMTDSNFSSYKGDGITETGNSYANQPSDWLDPVDDFINGGGNFACILAGHNHDGHMGTMTNYPNIFVYVSDKASVSRVSGAARITGEMNANAVSIVVINPVEKLFKIVKIGAQIDAKMRPQNVFCYDYANKRIISQW